MSFFFVGFVWKNRKGCLPSTCPRSLFDLTPFLADVLQRKCWIVTSNLCTVYADLYAANLNLLIRSWNLKKSSCLTVSRVLDGLCNVHLLSIHVWALLLQPCHLKLFLLLVDSAVDVGLDLSELQLYTYQPTFLHLDTHTHTFWQLEYKQQSDFTHAWGFFSRCTSSEASASSRASCSSSFSTSSFFLAFCSSWTLRPPSPSCSTNSLISSVGAGEKAQYYHPPFRISSFTQHLDATWEGFVLLADGLNVILALLVERLQLVELCHVGAALLLAVVQFQLQLLVLLAPFGRQLVENSLLLIQSCCSGVGLEKTNAECSTY